MNKKLPVKILILFFLISNAIYGQSFIKDFITIDELVEVNNQFFFSAIGSTNGKELWKTDGTKEGTFFVKDINTITDGNPSNLTSFNNELYFSADDGFFGNELWKSDGTETGTVMVKNVNVSNGQGSYPGNFTVFNNELYFTANNYSNRNSKLWKTNGTDEGTIKVFDAQGIDIKNIKVANNKMYFTKSNILYETNGNFNDIKEIYVDAYYTKAEFNTFNNELYFITYTSNKQSIRFYRLDNTSKPILLQEFTAPLYGDIDIYNYTQVGNNVYFSITTDFNTGNDTDVLWKTDGTKEGTSMVKSFNWDRYISGSNISNFVEYKNELYFNSGSKNNYTIWKSDGSETGTKQVIKTGVDRTVKFQIFNDQFYFSNGNKLWVADVSAGISNEFSDLAIATINSDALFNVKSTKKTVFFKANYKTKIALYTTEFSPLIQVIKGYSTIENNSEVVFESKVDSVAKNIIKIKNVGNKNLVFSKVKVVGQDFYINNIGGSFTQVIAPDKQSEFELTFYPSTTGLKKGTLSILSNDITMPNFNLELIGYAEGEIEKNLNENISLDKEIIFNSTSSSININNNSIPEDMPINSLIGILSIPNNNENFSYELIVEEGNKDNQYFSIENNELKTNGTFNFEQKNTYQFKVKATNNNTSETIVESLIISITDVVEDIVLEECSLEINNLGYGLRDVVFIDNQKIVAVGSQGVILKSDNGGNTWRKIRSANNKHLYNVQFTTNKIGYAIGDTFLKTEDAGESWFTPKIPDESYPTPTNLFFVNSDVGFVFGANGKIFKTTNGGLYWKSKNFGYTGFSSAYFFNESKGFIVGGSKTLIKTLDGGETWAKIDLGIEGLSSFIDFTKIYFANDLIGFISGNNGEIIKTIDGGNTWKLLSKLKYDISIRDVFFQDESIGYVLTENYLYKTIDGGSTWNDESLDTNFIGFHGFDFNKDNSKSCLVGDGTSCCSGFSTGHIIYTKELENDWVKRSYMSLYTDTHTAVYLEEDIGFVFGNNYGAKTIDGGLTWKKLTKLEDIISQVEVLNNNIYLLGNKNIYKSTDSGETWITLSTSKSIRKLFFINEQTIFGASYGQGVFKTTDGGINWVNVTKQLPYGVNINFLNENEGYVAGVNDGMFKTIDGGNTWTKVLFDFVDMFLNVFTIEFNKNIGFAGSSVGLLKTIDGGKTWVNTNINMGGTVKFLHATNEFEWYAVTDNRVLKTNDGGSNWETVYYGEEIKNVYFAKEKIYLVGYKNFTEIKIKSTPNSSGSIIGNINVSTQSTEGYSITKDEDVHYKWTVSGDNTINYFENKAEISWKSTGTYIVAVTPFNNCGDGSTKEIIVTVKKDWNAPIITGKIEVDKLSANNEYSAPFNDDSRYKWFVKGHTGYIENINNVTINWGEPGFGKIEVIETKISSGQRKKGYLDVTINPSQLSLDGYEKATKKINAYPNPTNGIFDIALPISLKEVQVTIYSINSQIIATGMYTVANDKVRVNIDNLHVGMYFIKVHLEVPVSLKIIKN